NPREHGLADETAIVSRIRNDSTYVEALRAAFRVSRDQIRGRHLAEAIAAFERTLVAGDSAFDRFLYKHDAAALSPSARRGLILFRGRAGCAECHRIGVESALLTDQAFHTVRIGLNRIAPRLAELTTRLVRAREAGGTLDASIVADPDLAELGHFAVTLEPADIGKFRTPSLRNVALTAPYMHDGSVSSLEEAIEREVYDHGNPSGRPLILTPAEKADLVAFLRALSSPSALDTMVTHRRPMLRSTSTRAN